MTTFIAIRHLETGKFLFRSGWSRPTTLYPNSLFEDRKSASRFLTMWVNKGRQFPSQNRKREDFEFIDVKVVYAL